MSFQITKSSTVKTFVSAELLKLPSTYTTNATPIKGAIIYDITTSKLYYGNATEWVQILTET
ncbi:MAG TPA: hypothetical protein PKD85_08630 [Saprospiraceae bacterium]|nr:hypothetical protein [Saprospiraceae bacterium]